MGIVVALARNINQWWQSLEPWALALAFVVVVFIVSVAVWFTCRYLSSVFWKRTDYAYFLFVILGGGLGAYDLAANDLYKESVRVQIYGLTNDMALRQNVSSALSICDREREQAKYPDVIDPNEQRGKFIGGATRTIPARDCERVSRISSDIEGNRLKTVTDYGLKRSFWQIMEGKLLLWWGLGDADLMSKIAFGIAEIPMRGLA